ncbi:MAG: hypothetical protein ACRCZI_12960 [Cetobacterium sp.]
MGEHFFTTYVRTKLLFKQRFNDQKDYDSVKIYVYELKKLGVNSGPLLYSLKVRKEISYDMNGNFKVLNGGPVDFSLLEKTRRRVRNKVELTSLHLYMREQLRYVSIDVPESDLSVYFRTFLSMRDNHLHVFFTVDDFSGRVHTPIVNLKGNLRSLIKLHGQKVVSLDVKQMQPIILAKILKEAIGLNAFSESISKGDDVYNLIQSAARLDTRDAAKKMLYQLIFGKPTDGIGKMFAGDTKWVDWINQYKRREEPLNPHKKDMHTNLAWLLQYSEVQVMTEIWLELQSRGIAFLTVHDELLCVKGDFHAVQGVMREVLRRHFVFFEISVS